MREVADRLFVGTAADYEQLVKPAILSGEWSVVQAAKDPYHRQALGYVGRGAPKDHPEYLTAERANCLILNIVDVEDPAFISQAGIDKALAWMIAKHDAGAKVLVHCNQGRSRSPTIAMLFLAHTLSPVFDTAEREMRGLYPEYLPAGGMNGFARAHWNYYQNFFLEEGVA